jgi:hypothetical protein
MRRLIVTTCTALATIGALAASWSGVRAAEGGLDPDAALVVTSVSPARNQETLPDLSDPGLSGRISVKFSTYVRASDLLDDRNPVNGLSRKVAFLDQAFAPVHGSPRLVRNVLWFEPFDNVHPVLPVGRYSITFKSSIRSARGRLLNDGRADFRTSFTVGSGSFPVVLVKVSPRHGQSDVGIRREIVASFDVPLDPVTAFEAVRLEDRSTVPPTPVDALVTLERRGFDVVVHPTTPGNPPGTQLTLVIAGRGTANAETATVLRTMDGIEFKRDWGPRWTADPEVPTLFHSSLGDFDDVTGEFTMTFRTRDASAGSRR